jgi:hypothetical protein
MIACKPSEEPEPKGQVVEFTETDELFPNPERGLYVQTYYTSADLSSVANLSVIKYNRKADANVTVYLHSYYLTDYMESDIPQEFLDRLDANMQTLRESGVKVVLRFSYKSNENDAPWDATPEWVNRHIDQLAPYLQKNADVILCVQCGFIGVWGEWYYTSGFKMNPSKDADFEPRWQVLEHLLDVLPKDRTVALRTPMFKRRYLSMRNLGDFPLTAEEAYKGTNKARICAHNDCFVSSNNDVGTYAGNDSRTFWAEDSKYTLMGGETCQKCQYSNGENAIKEMEIYHWTYINCDYQPQVTNGWRSDGSMDIMLRRLGYRLILDKAIITPKPQVGNKLEVYLELHNNGFAAPMNPRDVELVLVSTADASKKFVIKQTEDPRYWLPGSHTCTLSANLESNMAGEYKLYLNLPDPYESLHNDPRYSIRLANKDVWEEASGYNYLTTVTIE